MGLFVQCLYALSLHLVAMVFGTAIPIYIPVHFWKMFYLLVCVIFRCTIVHHIGGCCSSALPSGTKKQTRDHRQLMLCVMGWEYTKLRTTTWGRG